MSVESNLRLLRLYITTLSGWIKKKKLAPKQNRSLLPHTRVPALFVGSVHLHLIGSLGYLLLLARVVTLVLVLRNSNENCSL